MRHCQGTAVTAQLTSEFTQEVCKHSLRRSSWSTLLPPEKAWQKQHDLLAASDDMEDGFEYSVHPFVKLCARGCRFKTMWKAKVERAVHINILEMKAHLREEMRLARSCFRMHPFWPRFSGGARSHYKGTSFRSFLDEQKPWLWYWQRPLPLLHGFPCFPYFMNPADGPSRDDEPPEPDLALSAWWDALSGKLSMMDRWLS